MLFYVFDWYCFKTAFASDQMIFNSNKFPNYFKTIDINQNKNPS